ncbi:TPA: hypothetical protein I8Y89_001418 [Legionella pneumophila]|nr:hypothetical protein [Legionella pneumophila]
MKKYLVGIDDESFGNWNPVIINAKDEEEAFLKYGNYYCPMDELFLDDIYEKTINMSFAEQFWIQTREESNAFNEKGDLLIDENEFKRRIQEYFKENQSFADIYIQYYFDDNKDASNFAFPEDMVRFMWLKQVKLSKWSTVHILNLNEVQEI